MNKICLIEDMIYAYTLKPKKSFCNYIIVVYIQHVIFLKCIMYFFYCQIYFMKIRDLFYLSQLKFFPINVPSNVPILYPVNNCANKKILSILNILYRLVIKFFCYVLLSKKYNHVIVIRTYGMIIKWQFFVPYLYYLFSYKLITHDKTIDRCYCNKMF